MKNNIEILKRKCPICQSKKGYVMGKLEYSLFDDCPMSRKFNVVACSECSFIFYDTPDTVDQFTLFYREHYFSSSYTTNDQPPLSAEPVINIDNNPLAIMKKYLKKDMNICEIGCGRGSLLAEFKNAGYKNLYGIEPSPDCVQFVRNNYAIEAQTATVDRIPFNINFDIIISTHVFEHVLNLREAVESVDTHLNDNGLVYIEVPDLAGYDQQKDASPLDYITFYEHINHFTLSSLYNLFRTKNFSMIDCGTKILDKDSRLPLPVIYAIFTKSRQTRFVHNLSNSFDIKKVAYWFNHCKFYQEDMLAQLAASGQNVYIWGINLPIQKMLSMSSLKKCNIKALIDKDPSKQKKRIRGRIIHSPEVIKSSSADDVTVVWGGPYVSSIKNDLCHLGYNGSIVII